jgi:hypothetical protein
LDIAGNILSQEHSLYTQALRSNAKKWVKIADPTFPEHPLQADLERVSQESDWRSSLRIGDKLDALKDVRNGE